MGAAQARAPNNWYLAMDCNYVRKAKDGVATTTSYFISAPAIMSNNLDTNQQITEAIERVEILSEHFTMDGPAWVIDEIENVTLHTLMYNPIGGSSYIVTRGVARLNFKRRQTLGNL